MQRYTAFQYGGRSYHSMKMHDVSSRGAARDPSSKIQRYVRVDARGRKGPDVTHTLRAPQTSRGNRCTLWNNKPRCGVVLALSEDEAIDREGCGKDANIFSFLSLSLFPVNRVNLKRKQNNPGKILYVDDDSSWE